jgi:nucleoside-triphosphatase THEP1
LLNFKNIIITGGLHSGKSTLVQEILRNLNCPFKGIFSVPIAEDGKNVGFALRLRGEAQERIFAHEKFQDEPRFDRYGLSQQPFAEAAIYIKRYFGEPPPLFVIDELGLLEAPATAYVNAVAELLASPIPTLLVVQLRAMSLMEIMCGHQKNLLLILADNNREDVRARVIRELMRNGIAMSS